jgi:cytochrome c2
MKFRLLVAGAAAATLSAQFAFADALHGDPDKGLHLYKTICVACHNNTKGKNGLVGPSLWGVYGRKAATGGNNFHYSAALTASGLTWDYPTLFKWEGGAQKFVPGTKMTYPGLKTDEDKNNMIAYLQTLHD